MEVISFPCHDWVMTKASFRKGEVINNDGITNGVFDLVSGKLAQLDGSAKKFHWFFESGHHTHTQLETGSVLDITRGWNTQDAQHPDGLYKIECPQAAVAWCFNEIANSALPEFSFYRVSAGEQHSFAGGAKWFFMNGAFTINGVSRTQPRAFLMQNAQNVTFDTDSMFIVIHE